MSPPAQEDQVKIMKKTPDDYIFGKMIGEGSFSTVYLAKEVSSGREFAIKVLEKRHILRENKREYVMREKEVLRILGNSCRYFVHLYWTFQDDERLYFVLTYAKNGELLKQITNLGCFSIECVRYYTCELILALEYLHSKNIIHRDLKPENILFDDNWHILITDFGSAKIVDKKSSSNEPKVIIERNDETNGDVNKRPTRRRNSFVGTAQFVSPEMLTDCSSSFASDLWSLGCIVYQMVSGAMPFNGPSEYLIFQRITKLDYVYPDGFDATAKDLVQKLLVIEPNKRLGAADETLYTSLRAHSLFKDVNWDDLGPPPKLADQTEHHNIPDHLEPGLDGEKMSKLHLDLLTPSENATATTPVRKKSDPNRKITDLSELEVEQRLEEQKTNIYNEFVEGNLILKQGLLDKKKGLFARRRMFLLTKGPHLYYVDPMTMTLKGEIPWSADLSTEAKNFKIFFIHTPNRKYYLEDPEGYALEWCKAINEVKAYYYPEQQASADRKSVV